MGDKYAVENQEVNIVSFGNCVEIKNGMVLENLIKNPIEMEKVKTAIKKGMGTCYCFMDLEEKWENMSGDIVEQLDGQVSFRAGVDAIIFFGVRSKNERDNM